MKTKDKTLILKITELCVNSTCETFHPFIDFAPHVNSFSINVHANGWNGVEDAIKLQGYYPPLGALSLQSVHDKLIELIKVHDFNYSPEQIKKTKAEKKASKIAELKREIIELEK